MRPWDGIIGEEEIRRYEAAGFGGPSGIGERPGLAIIDVQYRTVGTERRPFWDAIEEFKTSCGEDGWRAVDHIAPVLSCSAIAAGRFSIRTSRQSKRSTTAASARRSRRS